MEIRKRMRAIGSVASKPIGALEPETAARSRARAAKVSAAIPRKHKAPRYPYDPRPKLCQCENPWGDGEECLYCGKPVAR